MGCWWEGGGGEGEPVSREKAAVLFPRKISQPNRPVRFFGCPFCGVPANPEHGQGPGGHSLNTPSFSQTYGYHQSLSMTDACTRMRPTHMGLCVCVSVCGELPGCSRSCVCRGGFFGCHFDSGGCFRRGWDGKVGGSPMREEQGVVGCVTGCFWPGHLRRRTMGLQWGQGSVFLVG